jgi:hypothetical protein
MSLVIGAGWPVSVVVGLALPVARRLGYEGVAFMTVGVAGLLAALALAPAGRRTPWERMLAVAGGWTTGWLAAGFYVWADALFRIVNECVSTFRTSSWPCRCRFSRPAQRPAALQAER